MMLSLDTAYRSFGGEVEASSTPTICRLSDSRRHQLSAIAPDVRSERLSRGKTCTTGAGKMIAQSVAEIISRHVRLTVEGIDRMYLNVFVPGLQYEQGIVQFFR